MFSGRRVKWVCCEMFVANERTTVPSEARAHSLVRQRKDTFIYKGRERENIASHLDVP